MGGGGILSPVTDLIFGGKKGAETGGLNDTAAQGRQYASQVNNQLSGLQEQQTAFGQMLSNQAMGTGPSLAEAALRANNERTLAQQAAAVKSNRAVNPALAQRQVLNAAGKANQATAQQGAMLRMQEQQQNQQQFGNYINSLYSAQNGAIGAATGANSAAANASLANDAAADKRTGSIMSMVGSGAAAFSDRRAKKNIKPVKMSAGGPVRSDMIMMPSTDGLEKQFGKAGTGFGSLFKKKEDDDEPIELGADMFGEQGIGGGAMDDEGMFSQKDLFIKALQGGAPVLPASTGAVVPGNAKVKGDSPKNDVVPALLSPGEIVIPRSVVQEGPEAIKSFAEALYEKGDKKFSKGGKVQKYNKGGAVKSGLDLDKLKAYEYEYKDPSAAGAGEGKFNGIMAQDLEKAGPVGKSMVMDTPQGKMVDYGKGFSAILAAQVDFNERMKQIEKRFGSKKNG